MKKCLIMGCAAAALLMGCANDRGGVDDSSNTQTGSETIQSTTSTNGTNSGSSAITNSTTGNANQGNNSGVQGNTPPSQQQ